MDSLFSRGCCSEQHLDINNDNRDRLTNYFSPCGKLEAYNWLRDVAPDNDIPEVVEVRFKNTRKGYYRNVNELRLKRGDIIAVEASPGHDIGIITLAGELVNKQLDKSRYDPAHDELKKVYRKAKPVDIEKWKEATDLEIITMLKARKIASRLKLNMKIGDVEYQGDKTKAIFYYIADERVDFRELIKVLAETFRIRIEMRQIGARQEAGRIGGIGTCGRELCCSTFITNFVSVTTHSARTQEVSLNPQKLAGQCGKLKCCLNYELACYVDAQKDYPDRNVVLRTIKGDAHHQKTDVFRGVIWYSFDGDMAGSLVAVPLERVKEVMDMNKKGVLPDNLVEVVRDPAQGVKLDYQNVVGQDSLTRFEKNSNKKNKRRPPSKNFRNKK